MTSEHESKKRKIDDEEEDVNIMDVNVKDTEIETEVETEDEEDDPDFEPDSCDEWSGTDDEIDYIDVNYNGEDETDLRDFECLMCHCNENKINRVNDDSYCLVCIGCVRREIPNYRDNLYVRSWLTQCGPQRTHKGHGDEICIVCNNKRNRGFYMPLCRAHEADYY